MSDFLPDQRKGLQDMDPLLLDVLLPVSFDWRELANRLGTAGRILPGQKKGMLKLPQVIYRMASTACRVDSGFSRGLELTLNALHKRIIQKIEGMELDEIYTCVQEVSLKNRARFSGVLWAMATSGRASVRKLARIFLHRLITEVFSSYHDVERDKKTGVPAPNSWRENIHE